MNSGTERQRAFQVRASAMRAEGSFVDPEVVLTEWRALQRQATESDLPDDVRNLRTRRQRQYLEMRQGLIFSYGMRHRLGLKLYYAQLEKDDYDGVCHWSEGDTAHFAPIQLKEVVPVELNAKATVQNILDGLTKYGDSSDLTVGIHINRNLHLDVTTLQAPAVELAGVYLFFATDPYQVGWALYGDLRDPPHERRTTRFHHPDKSNLSA